MTEIKTDIIIIGGGTSGMAAAAAAAENGARVTVIEKGATTGGTGNMGMGIFGVETRLQREKGFKLTRGEAFKVLMTYNHWMADARLAKKYIDKSAETIDWLEKLGVKFADVIQTDPGAYPTCHVMAFPDGHVGPQASSTMIRAMTVKAQQSGVSILLRTSAIKISRSQDGIKVTALNASEDEITINGKAVIVGTGGFGDNPEWIKKYTGFEWGKDLLSFRIPGCVGDGIRMAWEAGAGTSPMIMHMIYVGAGSIQETLGEPELTVASRQPNMIVNLSGERFFDEEMLDNNTFTGNAIAMQKGRSVFNIIDDTTREYYEQHEVDLFYNVVPHHKIPGLGEAVKKSIGQGKQVVYTANSLEELAAKTGINAKGLLQSVDEYNKACENGHDDIFEKNPKYLKRLVKSPQFYAFKLLPGGYGTLGGIKINHRLEVLTKAGEPIPGLYAVGVDANNQYGESYCFILPGHTMGYAVNSGRMAGENAANYIRSL